MTLALVLAASLLSRAVPTPAVALQPLGVFDRSALESVAEHVRTVFGGRVTILEPQALPESAYFAARNRYRGDRLVEFLETTTPPLYSHVIGLTARDISITKGSALDWGVFGAARVSRRTGVVSTFRLGPNLVAPLKLQTRLNNVVTHELGHTFGLSHCPSKGCVMQDAEGGIGPVDGSTGLFCEACASRLEELLGTESGGS